MHFELVSKFKPAGDQPRAIEKLCRNLEGRNPKHNILLGVTGSGKTMTMASIIQRLQKPALVISPNKTLAAQLYQEFKNFFPKNSAYYFVSYYDYYQPEAYIPQTNTYIEKDAKTNEQLDRMRHAAVQDILSRGDVIIAASVSCIYNIGDPAPYKEVSLEIKKGQQISRRQFLKRVAELQYQRQDKDFKPGNYRSRGDVIEIYSVTGKEIIAVEFFGDVIEKISSQNPETREKKDREKLRIFPSQFWTAPQEQVNLAMTNIRLELQKRLAELEKQGKTEEAKRLSQRTNYDLELMAETGWCHGIENYSRHLDFRKPGDPPYTLLDYFGYSQKNGFLVFLDESHLTIPQIRAMSVQDRIRKETLVEYGFRLPSAVDNRPLTFAEFETRVEKAVYVSATPAKYEKEKTPKENIAEQLVRPTGLLEPSIEIRKTTGQIKDLTGEIKQRVSKKERSLVITLTKRLAEEIANFLSNEGIKTQYLHSEIKTLERPKILNELREGKFDALVGINLLREGLDLPEVALVAILDADKEGFLRNETTLIQTMGRAARHPNGHVIMYADKTTGSMDAAIKEIERRRKKQEEFNKKYKITPKAITKDISDWPFMDKKKEVESELWMIRDVKLLEKEMQSAADSLDFERAARIRDMIEKLNSKH